MVYTVTLNPSLDYYMHISELKSDVQIADRTHLTFGGKGINVSVILSRLGIDNTALGLCGGKFGEKLNTLLNQDGIKTDFVTIDDETRINVKLAGAKDIIINAMGPTITLKDEQALLEKLKEINEGDYLVLSGSIPSSMGSNAYERMLENINKRNINIVADTTGRALFSILKYSPFLIKPNNFELSELLGRELKNVDDVVVAARELQKYGAQNVLVSMGKQGMVLLDENNDVFCESIISGKVVNTTGCGDSTVAGFIAGYIEKGNYRYALKLANACANATAFSQTLAKKDEILKYV